MHKTTEKNCRDFFKEVDRNGNGYITLDEWHMICAQRGETNPVEQFMAVCTGWDGDENYQVTWEEYWQYCQATYDIIG